MAFGLTSCLNFEKSADWMDFNTRKDHEAYTEAEKIEYKRLLLFKKASDKERRRRILEKIKEDEKHKLSK